MNNIFITRFPYLFWNMKFEKGIDIDFENSKLKKTDEKIHNFKKMNKAVFLVCKYLPILLFFLLVFNKFDFAPNVEKVAEYGVSLLLTILLFYVKKYVFFCLFIVTIIVGGFIYFESVAFIVKYLFAFICVFNFANDVTIEPYSIVENKKTIASFVVER
ncbi:hypothetical protein [Campylobacter corcagiensis]|uniref:Uncharacterized protein n=1 Tax=Campylobacter corcagiensis TaxID=1448857 RepID=A0A7M1LGC7_9BACT|nr:hypothetical protein [Campylobacter corcagiensis]QOQ86545.1 hypothetical protein IMC76_00180 [Campylobacter corcagiensis]